MGVGCIFALQEYVEMRHTPNYMTLQSVLTLWTLYTVISALGFIAVWLPLRSRLQNANWRYLVIHILPLSILVCAVEVLVYAWCSQHATTPKVHRTYWERARMVLSGELVNNVAFFWIALFIARGAGYYERFRQKEITASRLQTELVGAQLRALRMQLNPHFLFNTMNGISSLIRSDPDGADRMLEQLSHLLRMTLDRGDSQQVPLREEIEFVQIYLDIQSARFGDRISYEFHIAPEVLDVLIPTMILQPLVENAYKHGIATSTAKGWIRINAAPEAGKLVLTVSNSGQGLKNRVNSDSRSGIGVNNVEARLQLHYRTEQSFVLQEIGSGAIEAKLMLPLIVEENSFIAKAE